MRILAVGAHPDDVELGAGATLAKHVMLGDQVFILVLSTGAKARKSAGAGEVATLRVQCQESAKVLGARLEHLAFPDQRFDTIPLLEITRMVEEAIKSTRPDVVYSHHGGDLNADHQLTSAAVKVACRPIGKSGRAVYAFEVPSSTEWGEGFKPALFVNVAGAPFAKKEAALACYANEMGVFPHPRSPEAIRALAQWRGATAGVEAAEAFEVIREVR